MRTTVVIIVGTSLKTYMKNTDQAEYAAKLVTSTEDPVTATEYGSEINTLALMIEKQKVTPKKVYVLASDTIEGQQTAKVVEQVVKDKFKFETELVTIQGLDPENEYKMTKYGLQNLITVIKRIIRTHGHQDVALNISGGPKAAIATARQIVEKYKVVAYIRHGKGKRKDLVEIQPIDMPPEWK